MKALFCSFLAANFLIPAFAFAKETKEIVLDVRTATEYINGHIPGAANVDFKADNFKQELAKMDKEKTYKVYCQVGGRAGKTVEIMKTMGFKNVENLGGVNDAANKLGLPITTN